MEKNTILAVVLSTVFLIAWWAFFQPKQPVQAPKHETQAVTPAPVTTSGQKGITAPAAQDFSKNTSLTEKEFILEGKTYKAVFSSIGASVKSWQVKEKTASIELVLSKDSYNLGSFDNVNYSVSGISNDKITFQGKTSGGLLVTKTFELRDSYFNTLTISLKPLKKPAANVPVSISWGPGLGTDEKEQEENLKLTRALGLDLKEGKLEDLKPASFAFSDYKWAAVDNRYFLFAVLPGKDTGFDSFSVSKENKKLPPQLTAFKEFKEIKSEVIIKTDFYLGPKTYGILKSQGRSLDRAVDFGWFGFLGKIALNSLNFFHKITHNYGWAIVLLTICIQLIVFPLTIKSFKAQADMKRLQPHIKEIQDKYKKDPKRLNVEMLNIYKTHKVNPLGGCLPMLLQLPIFWALFTTLRNAYELRGAEWMFWIKDLSNYDPYYVLPIVMGLGMLLQQKMVSVSIDPAQQKIMYLMPVVFTFMFIKFPSGLVIYWITNSAVTMIEQYVFLKKSESASA